MSWMITALSLRWTLPPQCEWTIRSLPIPPPLSFFLHCIIQNLPYLFLYEKIGIARSSVVSPAPFSLFVSRRWMNRSLSLSDFHPLLSSVTPQGQSHFGVLAPFFISEHQRQTQTWPILHFRMNCPARKVLCQNHRTDPPNNPSNDPVRLCPACAPFS